MNLIMDIGNTATKLAIFQSDKMIQVQTVATTNMLAEVEALLKKFSRVKHGLLSSVKMIDDLELKRLQKLLPIKILDDSFQLPFKNAYDTPHTLGVDRLALMAAAVQQYSKRNVLVIDAGSCVTYDFMDSNQNYLGGAISPGVEMRYKALETFTSNLPLLEKTPPNQRIGSSTEASIHSGVIHGLLHEMEGTIKEYQNKYPDLTVILTGGDTDFLCKQFKISIFANSNFLLEGLNFLLEFNSN
ncbi:MAG: type III pantothenate kinase [Flavobacteriaceae bacterium]|nr:type III pantothenate kinase [Flavobacteriaceae bacterium]